MTATVPIPDLNFNGGDAGPSSAGSSADGGYGSGVFGDFFVGGAGNSAGGSGKATILYVLIGVFATWLIMR